MPELPSNNILVRIYRHRDSLRVQGLLFTALPVAIVLGLAIGSVFYVYQQVAEQLALSRDQEVAIISADRLSENMADFVRVLTTLSNLDIVRSDNPTLQKNALTQARNLIIDFDGGVIVMNAEGIVTVTEPFRPDLQGQNFSDRSYFVQTRRAGSFTFSDIIQEPGSGEDIIVAAVPIYSMEGEFVGVLAGRFYVKFLRIGEEIRKLHASRVGEAYLVDRKGRVIYHPDYSLISTDFSQRPAVTGLMQGENHGAIIVGELGQAREVVGYATIDVTGWTLIIQESWSNVVAPAVSALRPVIPVILVGIVVLAVIVSVGVGYVVLPLTEMAAYSRRVAAGDYDVQVPSNPTRELRDLGNAFNEMVQQISRYQDGLRQYVAAITYTQEEERRRIARELHDDTIQSLIAIGQRLELARDMIADTPGEAVEQLRDLRKMVTRVIDGVRRFSRDLRPTALEDLGLVAALQYLINTLSQKDNLEVSFSIEGLPEDLRPDLEVGIYRIVQEGLTNVEKHANASHLQLQAQFLSQRVVITIRDDGVGFTVPMEMAELASMGHFGLMGLRERAQLFGGQVNIKSRPGEGTEIQVILPRHPRPPHLLVPQPTFGNTPEEPTS